MTLKKTLFFGACWKKNPFTKTLIFWNVFWKNEIVFNFNAIVKFCLFWIFSIKTRYYTGNFFLPPPPKKNGGNREIFGGGKFFLVVKNRVLGEKKHYFKNKFFPPKPYFSRPKKTIFFRKSLRFPPLFDPFMGKGGGGKKKIPTAQKIHIALKYYLLIDSICFCNYIYFLINMDTSSSKAQVILGSSGRVISPPFQKKGPFFGGGGMFFWAKILNFLELGDIKNFGGTRVLNGPYWLHFRQIIGQYWPKNPHLKFQKYGIFEHFRGISETFFLKQYFCSKVPKND